MFIRWSKLGVWQRLFERVSSKDQALGAVFLDGTVIRAHHKAAGAAKKGGTKTATEIVKLVVDHVGGGHQGLCSRWRTWPGSVFHAVTRTGYEWSCAYALRSHLSAPPNLCGLRPWLCLT
ncbi:hypothetical protein GS501_00370 [Saccharibacter sp. 17.LH.SD]|uniref:hypothetical protein n=1 Tax=Saccharibacter sp. 17.LH.SD TaxID=2689393 RepID=UPI00136CE390|nr:hypothetical protein [Saccharibacter sp. 17.LH.SD]MXV43534.1 hypothetical protein [Saccharibacter sp. 17.LH.SD]